MILRDKFVPVPCLVSMLIFQGATVAGSEIMKNIGDVKNIGIDYLSAYQLVSRISESSTVSGQTGNFLNLNDQRILDFPSLFTISLGYTP